jgi:ectoine hydroxylase-related dioxygenase (phytanoyl-CoA dioxygenase family)
MERLAQAEIAQYRETGYLGPFRAVAEDEMKHVREQLDRQILRRGNPLNGCHLYNRLVYETMTGSAILDRIESLLGSDILLWITRFFMKEPGGLEIPWHQDFNNWPMKPPINVSVWLSIDGAGLHNGCVQVIPGSHRGGLLPHIKAGAEMLFEEMADPQALPEMSQAINMEVRPGEFFIFDGLLLHHSNANASAVPRTGLTGRFTIPSVRIRRGFVPGVILVRGIDCHPYASDRRPPPCVGREDPVAVESRWRSFESG